MCHNFGILLLSCTMQIRWVGGFQYVSIYPPFIILQLCEPTCLFSQFWPSSAFPVKGFTNDKDNFVSAVLLACGSPCVWPQRHVRQVAKSGQKHWQMTFSLKAWESSCLCWRGGQGPGQAFCSNQMVCGFSGPRPPSLQWIQPLRVLRGKIKLVWTTCEWQYISLF